MRYLILWLCVLTSIAFTGIHTKKDYPKNYFQSPVGHDITLSGNFAELRPGHYHAGLDIRAENGSTGEPIFAAADGYVSRIKIQSGGYGKALYINHPNGYTTVYGHLAHFTPEIDEYVKKLQYQKESFELDVAPKANEIPVFKGREIAKLGMTGRSYGPHLHFEIRDTKTENIINPELFGIYVADEVPPHILKLQIYYLNDKQETQSVKVVDLIKTPEGYRVKGDTLELSAWRVGFAIKAYDKATARNNDLGLFELKMFADDSLYYQFQAETFSFDENRYVNAHMDYAELQSKKSYYNRTYLLAGNQCELYAKTPNRGVVNIYRDKIRQINMEARDVRGNSCNLQFKVRRAEEMPEPVAAPYNYILQYNDENMIKTGLLRAYLPKNALYENAYINYSYSLEESYNFYSGVHHFHRNTTPLHRYMDISIKPTIEIPDSLRSKAFVAYCTGDDVYNCGGKWDEDGFLTTKTDAFGDYCIMTDTEAPTIKPVNFDDTMEKSVKMSFKIRDNYPTKGKTSYLDYRATIDGQWILMEYDDKYNLIFYTFDEKVGPGEHTLRIELSDNRANKTVFEKTFVR